MGNLFPFGLFAFWGTMNDNVRYKTYVKVWLFVPHELIVWNMSGRRRGVTPDKKRQVYQNKLYFSV